MKSTNLQSVATTLDTAVPPGATQVTKDTQESRENINPGKFFLLLGQLALLAIIIRQFQIQSGAFLRVALLAYIGFAIHYFLPLRYRLPFFAFLSLLSIGVVFGLTNTLWLVGFGSLLITICHLPLLFWKRIVLLGITGVLFVLFRTEVIQGPWSNAIWPILGSMFIFRFIVYIYDTRHKQHSSSLSERLAYFFMLPNVCFPMFPVVDYTEFRRTYYNDERHRIYQIGIDWMVRGIVQLLLYRIIYQYFTLTPSEVTNPDTLVQFLVSNFLLYLRISGYFHVITGLLHLFGFNLLATHHRYCLASSFTDFWRRINIYWKDFMMKVIYYPIMFKLRGLGQTKALVIATMVVFLSTWLLHSWLWFWLRGDFPIIWQDAVFWGTLGVVVIINSLMEIRKGRRRSLSSKKLDARGATVLGFKTIGIFFFICTLWSLWTCDSLSSWISMWSFLWNGTLEARKAFPGYFLLVSTIIFVSAIYFGRASRGEESEAERASLEQSPFKLATITMLLTIALFGLPQIYKQLNPEISSIIVSIKSGQLSRADEANLERGYYEQLTRVDRFNSQLWEMYMNKPAFHWLDIKGSGLMRYTGDFLQEELMPGFASSTPYGTIRTNSHGMRDKEYSLAPPADTLRIALLGASSVMGWGVEQGQTFEAITEDTLNAQGGVAGHKNVEILNFAVAGYYPLQQIAVLEKSLEFRPDSVFYVATGREENRALDYLIDLVKKDIEIPYPELQQIVALSQVNSKMDRTTIKRHLQPYRNSILSWLYDELVAVCRTNGITPVWVFLPSITKGAWLDTLQQTEKLAEESGFLVINMNGIFDEHNMEDLRLEEWDMHPNKLGHQLIANSLIEAVNENGMILSNR